MLVFENYADLGAANPIMIDETGSKSSLSEGQFISEDYPRLWKFPRYEAMT